jgi:Spy/CpxP family protein refolding chaperone
LSYAEEKDDRKGEISDEPPKPELNLDEEQRQKLERIVQEDTASAEIAEAILRRDGFN